MVQIYLGGKMLTTGSKTQEAAERVREAGVAMESALALDIGQTVKEAEAKFNAVYAAAMEQQLAEKALKRARRQRNVIGARGSARGVVL
jgi:hypothetical protein